jgi:hypothetical protein
MCIRVLTGASVHRESYNAMVSALVPGSGSGGRSNLHAAFKKYDTAEYSFVSASWPLPALLPAAGEEPLLQEEVDEENVDVVEEADAAVV